MNLFGFLVGGREILLGLVCLGSLAAIVVLVVVLATSRKGRGGAVVNPNLYPCPDCGHLVSRQAPDCPHCGRRLTGEGQP